MNLEKNDEYWSKTFSDIDFSGTDINEKEFDGCTFNHCNFSDVTFKRCNFVDCTFIRCNLSLVNLKYSKFSDVIFQESKLIGIDWTKVNWPRVIFSAPIKFYKSILNDSSFYGLPLQELVLEECKAHDVDFREGDFSHATFTYTDFTGSFFENTNLSGADFTEATDYDIDIFRNEIKHAKFSRFEAIRLLGSLEVELVD
ncbi:MAG: pentapeptide repeat-containing protein [Gammaproteobacteria bacterium]|nr:pentapeptide repeat-containing protein [Gammaproteobacteria bacterium]